MSVGRYSRASQQLYGLHDVQALTSALPEAAARNTRPERTLSAEPDR